MHPVIRYALAALLLLGVNPSYADTGIYWNFDNDLTPGSDSPVQNSSVTTAFCKSINPDNGGTTGYRYTKLETVNTNQKICSRASGNGIFYQFATFNKITATCPPEFPSTDSSGYCTDEPQCEAGSDTFLVEYTPSEMAQPDFNTNQAIISNGTCQYDSTGIAGCDAQTGSCYYEYTQTNSESTGNEPQPGSFEGTPDATTEGSSSNDGGQTTFDQDEPITNPDGSVTNSLTEFTTNTTGSGTTIWNDENNVYIRDSTGTVTTYERQKTTTTETDNSSTETVTTSKTTTTPTSKTTVINKGNGSATISSGSTSTTTGSTTTTTNTYDSEGNLTSSTSNTTGSGTEEKEGDENEDGNCGAPDQPSCEVVLEGEEHLEDPNQVIAQSGFEEQLDGYIQSFDEIGDGDASEFTITNPFSLPTTGTCNVSAYDATYHGETANFMTKFCSIYDNSLHDILAFLLYGLTLIALYYIYIETVARKT